LDFLKIFAQFKPNQLDQEGDGLVHINQIPYHANEQNFILRKKN